MGVYGVLGGVEMTPQAFQIIYKEIARKGHRKPGKAFRAAQMVLVGSRSRKEACDATGADRSHVWKLVNKFNDYTICECCGRAGLK